LILSPQDKRCLLELLPEHGGACQRLCFTTQAGERIDVLAGCTDAELAAGNPLYRGAWLYPFPSRLAKGRYAWQGKEYRFPLNAPGGENALHGFLNQLTPQIVSQAVGADTAAIAVQYRYDGARPEYPFPAEITVEYRLQSPAELHITMSVHNLHDTAVPVGVGWHPYFSLQGQVDELSLQLPGCDLAVLDAQLLPTGAVRPFHDFEKFSRVGEQAIDSSLKLSGQAPGRAVAQLWSEQRRVGVALWQDTGSPGEGGYRHMQVFIPPDRRAIALESVSCGVNAFNTGENLVALAPGATVSFDCGVTLLTSGP